MKVKIKELATIQMGYSFRSRLEASTNGDVAVIQMKDLFDNNVVCCDELSKIDMERVKDHHLVKREDLIFRSRGLVTTSAILLKETGKAVVAAPLLRIRITKPGILLPQYLNWYISQREAQIYLTSRSEGTALKKISKQTIEDMEIALPTLKTQREIVEFASLARQEQNLLLSLAEKRKQYISTLLMQYAKGEK